MKNFNSHSSITCREICGDDWEKYRDYYTSLADPAHYLGLFEGKNLKDDGTWKDFFNELKELDHVIFGLFDGDKMIGQTAIFFNDTDEAILVGSEIHPDYRGRGLSSQLYDIRKRYLNDIDFKGSVEAHIRPDNWPSIAAAERNGFCRNNAVEAEAGMPCAFQLAWS